MKTFAQIDIKSFTIPTLHSKLVATSFPQEDDGVPPNGTHTYIWEVKPEHGPTSNDSDCLTWAYHSHINPRSDVNTGLVGSLFEILLLEGGGGRNCCICRLNGV